MESENFENIFLSDIEQHDLLTASRKARVTITPNPSHLISLGFLQPSKHKNDYLMTSKGYRYLEYQQKKNEKEAKEKRMQKFQFWISLIVTNLISFAALIVSIIALSKQ